MKIGCVSELSAIHPRKWKDEFRFISQHFDHAELMMDYPHFGPSSITKSQISSIKKFSSNYGVELLVHAPLQINLGSTWPAFKKISVSEIKKTIDLSSSFFSICKVFSKG